MSVACVIITYRSRDVVSKCIDSVLRNDVAPVRVLVIDNNSGDNIDDCVGAYGDAVELVRNENNVGFAAAINQGVNMVLGDGCQYVLVLNADVELADDSIGELRACAESCGKAGLVGFNVVNSAQSLRDFQKIEPGKPACVETGWTVGCGMLINVAALRDVGYFDEYFFMYHEETDFIWRLKKSGWAILKSMNGALFHVGEHSSSSRKTKSYYYMTRNVFYFSKKHYADVRSRCEYICKYLKSIFWFPMHPLRLAAYAVGIVHGVFIVLFKAPRRYHVLYNKDMLSR